MSGMRKIPANVNIAAMTVGDALVKNNAKEIDLNREFSAGPVGNAKTFINEDKGAPSVSFSVENATNADRTIVMGRLANSQFKSVDDLLAAVGADALLDDGVIYTSGGENVTVVSNDSGRKIGEFLNYAAVSPLRLINASFESAKVAGGVDFSNYTTQLKTVFVSPFTTPKTDFLNLRKFQSNAANSPQFADIDFLKEGFLVTLSNENFTVFTVKAETVLHCTLGVGLQLSAAQKAFRAYKAADQTLAPFRG